MAFPTTVNDQITDSVSQINAGVVGLSPAMAMANLYMTTSLALSNAALNASSHQQHSNMAAHAAATMSVTNLLTLDTADDAASANQIYTPAKSAGL